MEDGEDVEVEGGEDEEVEEEEESDVFERFRIEVVRDLEELCWVGFGIVILMWGIESWCGGFGEKRGGGGGDCGEFGWVVVVSSYGVGDGDRERRKFSFFGGEGLS